MRKIGRERGKDREVIEREREREREGERERERERKRWREREVYTYVYNDMLSGKCVNKYYQKT